MKELKKFLNKSSNLIFKVLDKLSSLIKKEKNELFIKTIIKLIVLFIIFFIGSLISEGIILFGSVIIQNVAKTGRGLLSSIWSIAVSLTYFIFIVATLYNLLKEAEKDKNFISLFKNKEKDKESKKKLFLTVENVIKVLSIIVSIPMICIIISCLFILGIMFGYLRKNIYLISLFGLVIGVLILFVAILLLLRKLFSDVNANLKKYAVSMCIAAVLIAASSIGVLIETSSYDINKNLTSDFTISKVKYEYKMDTKKDYYIFNNGNDKNIELILNDDMGSYIEITLYHSNTSEVSSSINTTNSQVRISYNQEFKLEIDDLEKIYNLGLSTIKDKTIYNYTLLKYAKIEVRVSEKYADKIKFINEKGKVYTPYERID